MIAESSDEKPLLLTPSQEYSVGSQNKAGYYTSTGDHRKHRWGSNTHNQKRSCTISQTGKGNDIVNGFETHSIVSSLLQLCALNPS